MIWGYITPMLVTQSLLGGPWGNAQVCLVSTLRKRERHQALLRTTRAWMHVAQMVISVNWGRLNLDPKLL